MASDDDTRRVRPQPRRSPPPRPEVEEQPENGVDEEEPEDVDEPIDEIDIRAQHATDLLIENLFTDFAVDVQDQRLCKYEAVAVACRVQRGVGIPHLSQACFGLGKGYFRRSVRPAAV